MSSPNGPATCLYECGVMHCRLSPGRHQFSYRIFLFSLDLDEIDATAARVHGFSRNCWNLYTFRDRDHLTLPGFEQATVKENILAWIGTQPDPPALPDNPKIVLITLPRVLGYIFNPVSFYFLSDRATGAPLGAVVQVGNTFREMKPYLLRAPAVPAAPEHPRVPSPLSTPHAQPGPPPTYHLITPKHFYVSPFSALDLHFDFKLKIPGDHLDIHIDDRDGAAGPHVLLSALTGKRQPLTTARLLWLTAKFPLITLKVIILIHWQAFRLWLRKLPFHRKSANPQLQQDVHNPHR